VSKVNSFFVIRDEFPNLTARFHPDEAGVSGHVMVARAGRPVQARRAPAMPVAFGDP
jgi:hypothetical protein